MDFKISLGLLEELVKSVLHVTCTFEPDVIISSLKEDVHFLTADKKPYFIDKILEVSHKPGICSTKLNEGDIYRLNKEHNLVAEAHTHPDGIKPSDEDLEMIKEWGQRLKKPLYLMIIGYTKPYTMRVWQDSLDIPAYLKILDCFAYAFLQEIKGRNKTEYELETIRKAREITPEWIEILDKAKEKLKKYREQWVDESAETFENLVRGNWSYRDLFWDETFEEARKIKNLREFLNVRTEVLEGKYMNSGRGKLMKDDLMQYYVKKYMESVNENIKMYNSNGKETALEVTQNSSDK